MLLVTPSVEIYDGALCSIFKLCAPLRVFTPKLLVDAKRRNEQNTGIVVVVSKGIQRSFSSARGTTNCNPALCLSKNAILG